MSSAFPRIFRFQLNPKEVAGTRSQRVILNNRRGQNIKFMTYAFTEHGAIMAAAVLNSPNVIKMSVYVVRALVQLRDLLASNKELAKRLDELEMRIERKPGAHDEAIAAMLSAFRELMSRPPPSPRGFGFTAEISS